MQLFIFLALFILPLATAQLYSTDSHARSVESTQTDVLFKNVALAEQQKTSSTFHLNEEAFLLNNALKLEKQAKIENYTQRKKKSAQRFSSKKNKKGIQLLSALMILKNKQK